MGRLPHQLLLRQFPLHGLFHRHRRICRPCHTHGLVYISPPGQGVPDGAAQTGGRPSERFDLCGMVVSLILEIHQPFLFHSVYFHRDHDAASVDLFRFLLVL